jgi:hypothetical protein
MSPCRCRAQIDNGIPALLSDTTDRTFSMSTSLLASTVTPGRMGAARIGDQSGDGA